MADVDCPLCNTKISFWSVQHDKKMNHPMFGSIREDQDIVRCPRCERMMHTDCVKEMGISIEGRYVRHAGKKMKLIVDRFGLMSSMVPFCAGCGEVVIDNIVGTFKEIGNFEEGARFLGDGTVFRGEDPAGDAQNYGVEDPGHRGPEPAY